MGTKCNCVSHVDIVKIHLVFAHFPHLAWCSTIRILDVQRDDFLNFNCLQGIEQLVHNFIGGSFGALTHRVDLDCVGVLQKYVNRDRHCLTQIHSRNCGLCRSRAGRPLVPLHLSPPPHRAWQPFPCVPPWPCATRPN